MRLSQVLALDKSIKPRVYAAVSELHKILQKPQLFNGFNKFFTPVSEDGEKLPPEGLRVQHNVAAVLREPEYCCV